MKRSLATAVLACAAAIPAAASAGNVSLTIRRSPERNALQLRQHESSRQSPPSA